MEGEVTMICVDTSITDDLCWFHDQIHAVTIYCRRKLKAHPDNLIGVATFFGSFLDPTKSLENVTSYLGALKPLEQKYTDLLQGLKYSCYGFLNHQNMKKRIVVFSGCPLLFTRDQLPEALDVLKERRVALDVVDFGTRTVHDEEDSKAKNLKAFVEAYKEIEDSRYFLIEDDGFCLYHHISNSPILPPLSEQAARIRSLPIRRLQNSHSFWSSLQYSRKTVGE